MQIRPLHLLCYLLLSYGQALALEHSISQTTTKPIDEAEAKSLIANSKDDIAHLLKINSEVYLYNGQYFKIIRGTDVVYVISAKRTSEDKNPTTCSALLFNRDKKVLSVIDVMGNDNQRRPWNCDYVTAMSFKDNYPDGSMKVIGMYRGTAPSNEHFLLSVIMKLDFRAPSLEIDEGLTSKLEDVPLSTIKEVRSYLNKIQKNGI